MRKPQTNSASVYSTTAHDWRLVGELRIGDQVLTHAGRATLTAKRPAPAQTVVQDATGRQLAISDFEGQAGVQRFELRSDYWAPGTYWVSVIVDGHRRVLLVEKF